MPIVRLALLACLIVCPGLTIGAGARAQQSGEVEIRRGLQYGMHDGVALLGDLYAPKAAGKYATIIAVHGGGWQGGSRANYQYWGPYLAQRGYVLFAIDYRLVTAGQKMYPQSVQDVRAAVQFLRANGQEIKADPERIGLLGDSAGAHLAALVGLVSDAPAIPGAYRSDSYAEISSRVKVVVGFYGVYDMLQQWEHDQIARPRDQITEKYLGLPPMEDRRLYFDSSPMSYAVRANNHASFLIAYGTEDDIVDAPRQSAAFVTALKQAGFYVRTVIMPGAPHYWNSEPLDEPGGFAAAMAPKLLRFLKERL